jgi:hypothetical protein
MIKSEEAKSIAHMVNASVRVLDVGSIHSYTRTAIANMAYEVVMGMPFGKSERNEMIEL